jgi:iron complex transport system ATP-binding protein
MRVENLRGGYPLQENVVRDVSFDIQEKDFLGIIGPNGSGKSTLLRLLSRALPFGHGTVTFQGKEIRSIPLKRFCRSVAFVSQDTFVHFPFTVKEIALMGRIPHLRRLQKEQLRDAQVVEQALFFTNTLQFKDRLIDQLSAGERQRVLIAKALAQQPALLFLDEPTSHLDIGYQVQTLGLLRRLNREQSLTVVVVMHDLNLASEYCNRLILLQKGAIYKEGTPEQVLTYQNIEQVYKTPVLVHKNPGSSKPYVMLVTNRDERTEDRAQTSDGR